MNKFIFLEKYKSNIDNNLLYEMDGFPCSQPNHDSITVLKSIKKTIERELKNIADSKNHNHKDSSYQIIRLKLSELATLDVTIGDLRVTKIGKLMTKLQGQQLPPYLSQVASRLNDKWKALFHSYREELKRSLSEKVNFTICALILKL